MSRLREREKRKREEFKAEVEDTISVEDLKRDKHISKLFGLLLKRDDNSGLAEKVLGYRKEVKVDAAGQVELDADGFPIEEVTEVKVDKDDRNEIRKYREEIQEIVDKAEKVAEILDEDMIADLGRIHEDFGKVVLSAGNTSEVSTALVSQLEILLIDDPSRFNNIAAKLEQVKDRKGKEEGIEEETSELCKKYDISYEEVDTALNIDDIFTDMLEGEIKEEEVKELLEKCKVSKSIMREFEEATSKNFKGNKGAKLKRIEGVIRTTTLDRILKEKSSWLGRLFKGSEFKRKKDRLLQSKKDLEEAIEESNKKIRETGQILAMAISQNDYLEEAIANIGGGPEAKDRTASMTEARDFLPDDSDIDEEWHSFRKKEGITRAAWTALTPDEQKAKQNAFINNLGRNKVGGKKGFWAEIMEEMLKTKLQSKSTRAKLTVR